MNDEIKEILDNFKCYEERYKKCNEAQFIIIYRDIHLLLDYITNLQQENERLKELDENYPIEEELAEAYRREEDYKSRIEKAVEYIKEHIKYECDDAFNGMQFYSHHLYDFSKDDLLNILNGKGSDK